MICTRRDALRAAALLAVAGPLAQAKGLKGLKLGVTDWNLRMTGKPEAVAMAAGLGFQGVEVSLGRTPVDGKLPVADAAIQETYRQEAARHKIALAGTCLDILHVNYLKSDPLGVRWVADGIPITKALKARTMLLPFFGRGAIKQAQEQQYVADALKDLARDAEKAGVLLGLENTISAEENVRMLERINSPAVKVYYDIGNSHREGYDVAREIRWLGAKRICQFHFKDNPHYLGEGKIDVPAAIDAVAELDFKGFANLETDSPSKSVEADMKRNLTFVRRLMENGGRA